MSPLILHALGTSIAVGFVLVFDHLGRATAGLVAKTVASILFVHLAYMTGALQTAAGQALFVALLLGLVGDVGLGLGRRGFIGGLAAFFLGHVALVIALYVRGGIDATNASIGAAVAAGPMFIMQSKLRKHAGKLMVPALLYMAVISVAWICAAGAVSLCVWVTVGVALFWVSDIFVARRRFWAPGPWNRRLGLPLYYAGQLLLAAYLR